MDTILIVGEPDKRLDALLSKLGYGVERPTAEAPLPEFIHSRMVDLVVLDGRAHPDCSDLCEFLRKQETTRGVPIVFVSDVEADIVEVSDACLDKVDVLQAPFTVGALASRIATSLRLHKFAGADDLHATIAETNARLRDLNARFKKDLDDARAIQEGLLPTKLPGDKTFEIAASYQPLEEVGGDWYFCEKKTDGTIIMGVADVTGHGLSAAFIGAMTKLALCAAGKTEPHEILREMNRLMAPQIPSGRFVTMCCARYHPESGLLQFARAGHPPGILVRGQSREQIQLKGDGFAVGFFDDAEYALLEETLNPGDVFLLYTDGLSEAQNRSMQTYGIERLAQAVGRADAKASSAGILEAVLDDFDAFREERILKDDVTILALRRIG